MGGSQGRRQRFLARDVGPRAGARGTARRRLRPAR
uniref:Ppr10 n=1 Tax=Arundo donax TaxID=35708 RepID=A0A0A9HM04_ARUDO